jgi:hypothetical protein
VVGERVEKSWSTKKRPWWLKGTETNCKFINEFRKRLHPSINHSATPVSFLFPSFSLTFVLFFKVHLVSRRMQRPSRGQARISPPIQRSPQMGSDSEKGSKLNQRNFGIINRIWLIISLILFVVLFTHFAFPSTHSTPARRPYSSTNLKSKNYLNASDTEPNPFDFCPVYGPGDEIGAKYGAQTLSKSRMHLGSGDRIQRVLNRALAGHPVTISILGGSGAFSVVFPPNFA